MTTSPQKELSPDHSFAELPAALVEEVKKAQITLTTLHERATFDRAWNLLKQEKLRNKIYAKEGPAAERFADAVREANPDEMFNHAWLPVANLFKEDKATGRRKVEDALHWLLEVDKPVRPILVIDVSKEKASGLLWNDTIQALVTNACWKGQLPLQKACIKKGRASRAINCWLDFFEEALYIAL
jgi:predicted transposase YbfD/YdcC